MNSIKTVVFALSLALAGACAAETHEPSPEPVFAAEPSQAVLDVSIEPLADSDTMRVYEACERLETALRRHSTLCGGGIAENLTCPWYTSYGNCETVRVRAGLEAIETAYCDESAVTVAYDPENCREGWDGTW